MKSLLLAALMVSSSASANVKFDLVCELENGLLFVRTQGPVLVSIAPDALKPDVQFDMFIDHDGPAGNCGFNCMNISYYPKYDRERVGGTSTLQLKKTDSTLEAQLTLPNGETKSLSCH